MKKLNELALDDVGYLRVKRVLERYQGVKGVKDYINFKLIKGVIGNVRSFARFI